MIENNDVDIDIQLEAVKLIDESREEFLDTALRIISNKDKKHNEKLISELIDKIFTAKRSNRSFASRRPFFFNILRGLLDSDQTSLRNQALEILASQEDAEAENILLELAKYDTDKRTKDKNQISQADAIHLLRHTSKNQHIALFNKLVVESDDIEVKKAAIRGLDKDLESTEMLMKIVNDKTEDFSLRQASAASLHHMETDMMNDMALEIISESDSEEGNRLVTSRSPSKDEVDFKTGLLNMLTFTGDMKRLKKSKQLKESLKELKDLDVNTKSKFRGSFEMLNTNILEDTSSSSPTLIEQMASKTTRQA